MKNIFYFIGLTTLLISLQSCGSKQENTSIDILLCKLSADAKLTEDARELLLPFEREEGIINLPQGIIFNPSDTVSYIKEKTWLEKLRGNLTKNTTVLVLKEKISNHLSGLDLSVLKKSDVTPEYINNAAKNYETVVGYGSELNPNTASNYSFKCFSKYDELSAYLSDSVLAKNPLSKILIIHNPPVNGGGSGNVVDPEKGKGDKPIIPSLPDPFAVELKTALMQIRNFKESENSRKELINSVWKKYFSETAYVERITELNDPMPDQWPQGKGKEYLVHLAALESILEVNLVRIETDGNTKKVSSLTVYEIHQGSSFAN
jgi:hypothetical protein